VTSTLEEIPRRFKVIDTVREKFAAELWATGPMRKQEIRQLEPAQLAIS